MIRNYLLVAFRNLLKNKSYIIINTLGLGISLACCITAYLLLAYNLEFDSFHSDRKVSHLYRVHTLSHDNNGKAMIDDQAPLVLAPIASEEISGLGRYTRYIEEDGAMRYGDKAFNEGITFADSSFFDLFDFPLATGNVKSFHDKKTIFLSGKMARKYFGDDDPTGKLMVLDFANNYELEVLVGGVMKKVPNNSTFAFDAMLRIENYMDIHKIKIDDWTDWRNPSTFFEVPTEEAAAGVSRALGKYIPNKNNMQTDKVESFQLVPFKSNYTWDDIRSSWTSHRIGMGITFMFISMAVLVMLIACFNLTNTSLAMTTKRLKEVGVRKAIGAGRGQIAFQFLLETLITIVLSLSVGLLVAQVIVPAFYSMWRIPFGMGDLDGLNFFILLIMLVFLAAVVAGIYPALLSSKFKPTLLLKGSVKIGGTNLLMRALVGAQFTLSIMVLIAGISFFRNSRFQEKIQFGYDKEMVLMVRIQGESDYKTLEAAVKRNPKVLSIAVSVENVSSNVFPARIKVDTAQYEVQALGVGKNYFETLGLRFADGRSFDPDNASDFEEGMVVNKEFVRRTGIRDPIDKVITLHNNTRRRILGIVENHVDNLWRSANFEPFIFYPAPRDLYGMMLVRAEKADLPDVQKFTERTWKEVFPTKPFESAFQEDLALGDVRETNGNMQNVFLFITVLGGLLSASGIFALASLNIAKRTKEIGIRKALGASVLSIISLLNREFVIILLCAGILGGGGGYFLTGMVLGEFYAYHAPVEIGAVILCGLTIFCFGILATGSATVRAARANPVKTLRTE